MQQDNLKVGLVALILISPMALSPMALSQNLVTEDNQWIEVPAGKQAVFIPSYMSSQQCNVVCTEPVMYPEVDVVAEPEPEPEPEPENDCRDDELVVSPAYCILSKMWGE